MTAGKPPSTPPMQRRLLLRPAAPSVFFIWPFPPSPSSLSRSNRRHLLLWRSTPMAPLPFLHASFLAKFFAFCRSRCPSLFPSPPTRLLSSGKRGALLSSPHLLRSFTRSKPLAGNPRAGLPDCAGSNLGKLFPKTGRGCTVLPGRPDFFFRRKQIRVAVKKDIA